MSRADSLGDARKAVDGSDYMAAQPLLQAALKAGTAGPADLAEIYRLTGIVEAALDNAQGAQIAFGKWLALDPKGSLPPGTSPKITRPFGAAQDQAKKRGPLTAKAKTTDNPPTVTLVVVNDPMKMIAGAKVYFSADRGAEETLSVDGTKRLTIELGTGSRIDLRLHGVDEFGNRVVELGSKDVPIVITSTGKPKVLDERDRALLRRPPPSEPDKPRPWYLQWWVWGIAAGTATGIGGYFAFRTADDINELNYLNANSLAHPWSEAQDVEARAKRDLLVTNIAAGTAGAFAIGTVILYLTRPKVETEAHVTIAPTSDGATIVLGGQF